MRLIKRHSFFLKSFLGSLLIITGAIALASLAAYRTLDAYYLDQTRGEQDRLARIVQDSIERTWDLPDDEIDALCKRFFAAPADYPARDVGAAPTGFAIAARLTVIGADGRVRGDSHFDPKRMENHKTAGRPEVLAALGGNPGYDERVSETGQEQYLYLARPIRRGGAVVGLVRIALPIESIARTEDFIFHVLLWVSVAGVATAVLLGLLISWIWYVPLRRITQAARQIASGNVEHGAKVFGTDELAQLGAAVNELRDNLAGKLALITAQREDLETIVANLDEGVIATDSDARVVLMNPPATQLLARGAADIVGKRLGAAVHHPAIAEIHAAAIASGRAVTRQIEADVRGQRRTIEVHATPVSAGGSDAIAALIVTRDITDLARAATMKAEFAANASHELRTPLATLRAAVDSLAAADLDDRQALEQLVAILNRHVSRLEQMTLDLLDLHIVESGKKELVPEEIGLGSLAAWTDAHFASQASEKGVALDVAAEEPHATLTSDRKLLELILQNLVDNAIKFTPGGGRVACRIEPQGRHVRIEVRDTGCGIPPEDQPRIFDRFYQADSSRSGDARLRGTGLGLAIVKHAAERLDARIDVESEVGKGTTVTVLVPRELP